MKIYGLKSLVLIGAWTCFGFGCAAVGTTNKAGGEANAARDTSDVGAAKTAAPVSEASPCANKYNPVSDGRAKNFKLTPAGKTARFVQRYAAGAADFTEEMTMDGAIVKHNWKCTPEGLIAANPGSGLSSQTMQITPKHISGVTLPNENEIAPGKTWTSVYQANGTSPLGDIESEVTIDNKVVALDDEVKVPAGTFKAAKVEMDVKTAMTMGGKKIDVPLMKSYVWYAPNVGMVKNSSAELNSAMEYTGDK